MEFARRLGVSRQAVAQYIKKGQISNGKVMGDDGFWKIIESVAREELGQNVDQTSHAPANKLKSLGKEAIPKQGAQGDPNDPTSMMGLKKQQIYVKVQKDLAELRKMQGQLVDREKVMAAQFAFGKLIRDALMAVPDRVVDDVLASRSRGQALRLISEAIEDALRQLADGVNMEFNK